ncbi:hypothetical protein PRIPAC_87071 [Pristionchus pacificus]|nr:hypothetical protein PRIPAC_87071 [Pristionchus pacificus]
MEERICLVCSVPITVSHLGVDVCRACAAFFKRTTIAGRSFTCIQKEGKCTYRRHEEFMCKSCRLDRCLELGMVYVEPTKRRRRVRKEVVEDDDNLPSVSSPRTIPTRDSLIERMAEAYISCCDRRLVREREYAELNDLQMMDHPSEKLYIIHFTVLREMTQIAASESMQMLKEAFDEYESLSTSDKATVFKSFFGKLRFLEIFYYSSLYFGEDSNCSYMVSLITCLNTGNVEDWVTVKDEVERKDELRASLKGFADEYLFLVEPMLRMDKLTEREFHALLVLAFCDNVIDLPLSDETFDNFERIRLKVLAELREYYRHEMRLDDFSNRLGNLMIIAQGAGEAVMLWSKELRIYDTLFDLYENDQLIRDTFLN